MRDVVEIVSISTGRVHLILHDFLDISKVSALCVPRLLTLHHNRNRVTIVMEMFRRNPNDFFAVSLP